MYFKKSMFIVLVALGSFQPAFAERESGVGSSGGADYQMEINAWFTSVQRPRAVLTCIQSTADFGFDQKTLKEMVKSSFQKWANYLNRLTKKPCQDPSQCTLIATKMIMLDHCDGEEDLTIYFGVKNANLLKRKQNYRFPFAFAELVDRVDPSGDQAFWSKGLIWIAPPRSVDREIQSPLWTNYEGAPLERALLHEFGHVFGVEHVEGTIMDAHIGDGLIEETQFSRIQRKKSEYDSGNLEIDSSRFLVFRPETKFAMPLSASHSSCERYNGAEKLQCIQEDKPRMRFAYRRLTGQELPGDQFTAILAYDGSSSTPIDTWLGQPTRIELVLSASGKITRLLFRPGTILNHAWSDSAFKTRYPGSTSSGSSNGITSSQYSILGLLVRPDGSSSNFILNLNWGRLESINLVDPTLGSEDNDCSNNRNLSEICPLLHN